MKKYLVLICIVVLGVNFTLSQGGFVENKGQVIDRANNLKKEVKYYYSYSNTTLFFENERVIYSFINPDYIDESKYKNNAAGLDSVKANRGATFYRLDMLFEGANKNVKITSADKLAGETHFYLNKRNGIRNVGTYKTITYNNIYNDIDVVFYKNEKGLKYDIVLHEGANLNDVKIKYLGAEDLKIEKGKLIIKTNFKTIEEEIPFSFINGDKSSQIKVTYKLKKDVLSFETEHSNYQSLTIDPVLEWATYLNGTAATTQALDYANSHLDANGNFFVYGQVYSAAGNYPVISPGGSAYTANYNSSSDVYIAKFDANRALVWSTYLGGSNSDQSYGSNVITSRGNTLHIVGERISDDAPFTNGGGLYVVPPNNNQAFWARFNITTGALNHLTGIGGGYKPSIEISNGGNVGIIMEAYDFNNPIVVNRSGAYNQSVNGGFKDLFFMLFNTSYNQIWGTFLGGPSSQENPMFRFDNSNNIIFIGETNWITASNPTSELLVTRAGAYNKSTYEGGTDVMLGMFNSSGALVWNTLYGGDDSDARRGAMGGYAKILIDPTTQDLLMFWNTESTNLTTLDAGGGAYYRTVPTHPSYNGGGSFWNYAAYYAKFTSAGALTHASYWYNSTDGDLIHDVTFGGCNKLYIVGRADPATVTTITQPSGFNLATGGQVMLMQMDRTTLNAEWLSHLSSDNGYGPSIAGRTDNPRVYVASEGYGNTATMVNPGGGAYYNGSNINGTASNFMIWQLHPSIPPTITGDTALCQGETTTLTASGGSGAPYQWYTTPIGGTAFFTGAVYTTPALTSNTTYYVSSGTGLCISSRTPVIITVATPTPVNNTTSTAAICEGTTKALTATPSGGTWSIVSGGGSITGTTYTAPTVASNTSVTVKYRVPSSGSCPADSANVTFTVTNTVATANTTNTSTICETATKALTGNPSGGTWSVVSGGGSITGTTYTPANITNNTSVTIKYRTPGTGGCPADSANVTFTVEPTITPLITSSAADMCNGDTRALTGTPAGGTWAVVNGPGSITGNTLTATGSGTIQVRYRIVNACGNNDVTQNITVASTITVSATASASSLCENITRTMTGTPSGGAWAVLNGPGTITGGVLTPSGVGTVRVEYSVTSSCGNGADTIDVVINPVPNANAGIDENICTGDTITLTATGGGTYQWNPGSAGANNQVFPIVTTGYRVDVTSDSGCVASDSVTVFVQSTGIATAQNDQSIVATGIQETIDVYTNDIGGISTIQILNGPSHGTATVSGGNILYTSISGYIGNDTVFYEICDANCGVVCDTAYVAIVVENDLTIPIGISPNGDGKNDVFNILGLSRYPNNHLYIYNRWGSLVYEAQPYMNDWNGQNTSGSLMGDEVTEGTYFYILELGEDIPVRKGYIELKK